MRKSLPMFALSLVLVLFALPTIADDAAPSSAPAGVVNINTAGIEQLTLLPRVGEKAAQRIVAYRTEHGPFKKATDLMQVKGIGAMTYEGMSAYIAVDGKTTLTAKVRTQRKKSKPSTPAK